MSKPLLLVDVGGVIVVPVLGRPDSEFELSVDLVDDCRVPKGIRERFRWARGGVRAGVVLGPRAGRPDLARMIGFGAGGPVIRFGAGSARDRDWKLWQVRRWCRDNAEGRKVASLDDGHMAASVDWADARGGALLIWTDPTVGLTGQFAQQLLDFAARPG